jgi:hypothetical protein
MSDRYKVKTFGPDDWCIIDTTEVPTEHNYYGMVSYGFFSAQDADKECAFLNAQHRTYLQGTFYDGGEANGLPEYGEPDYGKASPSMKKRH